MREVTCPACGTTVSLPPGVESGRVACGACQGVIDLGPPPAPLAPAAEVPLEIPVEVPPPAPASYPVSKFEPPTGGNPVGLLVPLVAGVVAALFLAVGAAIVREFFWLVIVFPAAHGLAVGGLTGLSARLVKVRLPLALGLIGFGCGVLSWFCVYFLFYLASEVPPGAQPPGFLDFMDQWATRGVQIGKAGRGGGTNLGYTGTIIYWIVEAVITGVAAGGLAIAPVMSPFCVACNAWKRKRVLGPYRVEPMVAAGAVAAGVPAGIASPAEKGKKAAVNVYACPYCGTEGTIDVSLEGSHTEGKKTTTYKVFMTYPGAALADFERAADECHEMGLKTK